MIDKTYLTTMAKYNSWQNRSLYTAAATLSDEARRQERGAFFGSIHTTLNHLLWADRAWLPRFTAQPLIAFSSKEGLSMYPDFEDLKRERLATDAEIEAWAEDLDPQWLEGDLVWFSGLLQRELTMNKQHLVMHFFNHETHHRGQVHAMLTMAGAKPEDTDLMLMKI